MCGLAVMLGLGGRKADATVLTRMSQRIAHRGPDDSGLYLDGQVGFAFRRLSILDLSPAGHQPMVSDDGRLAIVFNGEIYNYVELREDLRKAGFRFHSQSDTEVLLAAYRRWGADCLDRLNGMWAFVIYDRAAGLLFGARDRFGIKPLFVHRGEHCWLFASEIKGILASGLYAPATNWQVAADFLIGGKLDETPGTFFQGIEQIPPGSAFELRLDGGWRQRRYWSLAGIEPEPVPHVHEAIAALLEDAVRIRLRSDVPVGACLSGGLDSTAIICAMARGRQDHDASRRAPLLAFCYHEPAFDERALIADTLAQSGAELRRITLTPEAMWDSLTEVLRFQDEPIHSGAPIAGFHLMKLAACNRVTVVLNGQGADEVFAGYADYFPDHWHTLLRAGRGVRAWREIQAYVAGAGRPGVTAWSLFRHAMLRLLHHQARRFPPYRPLARRRRSRLDGRRWFARPLAQHLSPDDDPPPDTDLNAVLRRSVERSPLPQYLRMEDRNSMAHGVEVRLPFLDYRLVSLAFRVSADRKIEGIWNKALLRRSQRGRIPSSVLARAEKMGFPTSLHTWLTGALSERLSDLLGSRAVRESGIYDVEAMLRTLRNPHQLAPRDALRLFHVAEFEMWRGIHLAR